MPSHVAKDSRALYGPIAPATHGDGVHRQGRGDGLRRHGQLEQLYEHAQHDRRHRLQRQRDPRR